MQRIPYINTLAKRSLPTFVVIVALGLLLTGSLTAQTYNTLYNFSAATGAYDMYVFLNYNSDGCYPSSALLLSGNTLYGAAGGGGVSGTGTIYSVNTDGSDYTVLHAFGQPTKTFNIFSSEYYNDDGGGPSGPLILVSNTLYGVTGNGGPSGCGALFAINTDGSGFTNLYFFTVSEGHPGGGLALSGNTLYDAASVGPLGYGMVFAINTDGTGFINLYTFTGTNDGAYPWGNLLLSGSTLYGVTSGGGSSGNGTVFSLNLDGSGFTNLYSFTGGSGGNTPTATPILSGSTLYGTACLGNVAGDTTVYALNTNGTGFTNLYGITFQQQDGGGTLVEGLCIAGPILFGAFPGASGPAPNFSDGSLFALNTQTLALTGLHGFPNNFALGNASASTLIYSNYTLYGTHPLVGVPGYSSDGASAADGTVFSFSFAPQIKMNHTRTNITLSWPTNVSVMDTSGFTLQATTNLGSSALWTNVSPLPSVVNGQYTVTNAIAGAQMFYRLSQ